ncbi:Endothelin-converting enzyme 1 [Candidatus Sulfotelmatobacter kueseliae]|uniref:Endothelin-converting enzyme 1 n=1 Tax=Candidatus Sulfotelmatobacter kueseliae TaxID=2042962 RepID=A0A2U3KN02_9BACT|nr:Endothelin-converting enzyme 1 [Candidatus Sulfotelmatobacter kueseliae]
MAWFRTSFFALAVALLLPLAYAQQSSTAKPEPALDVTSMDRSVDPCVDFFTYSCGGWIKKNPIPPDQSSWDTYSKMEDENRVRLRGILEAASAPDASRNAVTKKIGDYYASCSDEKAIEANGAEPLKPGLERIDKISSKAEIAGVAATMIDDNVLFEFGSIQDFRDANQVIAAADQGGLGLPDRDYYLKDDAKSVELRKDYVAHVQKMFELLGDKPEAAAAEAQTVMRIETALAKGSMTRVERRDPKALDHKMTSAELEKMSPEFLWQAYFTKIGMPSLGSLNVAVPAFVKAMNEEIAKESLADWKTYLRWHLVHAYAPHLSSALLNENFAFYGKTLQGQQELKPRWKRCTEYVDGYLGEALGQAYVEKYFSGDAKEKALKMVKEIQAAMEQDINNLTWMSPATKQQALVKLHGMANKIGYPDKWRDYSKLEIVRGDEVGNVERARQFEFNRQMAKIGKPVDRGEWDMTPPTVNAYYNPQMNDINFPAGVLQPPAFDPNSDAAPNYGDTGGTIGHELTHGFDDEGRQFDAQGNLRDWWTADDEKKFVKRASCISDQYSTYTIIDDIKINGKLTLGEDTADLGGLILAYMAWQEDTKGQKLEPMEGLTPEQRFFIGYGQSWCGQTRDETKRLRATVDPHSPEKYRTNGVVSNMPEFQEAFHCKAGAPMVNQNRCRVW